MSAYTYDSNDAVCTLESCFDVYRGHVSIDNTSCHYIHGIYIRSCLHIHESFLYIVDTVSKYVSHVSIYI